MSGWHPIGDRPARVGLIGLGAMGRNHLRLLSAREDVQLVAISDPVPQVLEAAVTGIDAQGYLEPQAMLVKADLDAVVIASPTTTHLLLGLAAVGRGIATLIEKPLAATPTEAGHLVEASAATGVPIQVGHVERFNPAVLELGRLLEAGWLSTVYAITSRRAGPFPDRIRDVGVTIDLATHDVDILSFVASERPSRVSAETAQRVHEDHEDLLLGPAVIPVGFGRDAPRRLADAGQAAHADRGRRGGHVRARLPVPAADLHALDRHDEPAADPRICADVRGRVDGPAARIPGSRWPPSWTRS